MEQVRRLLQELEEKTTELKKVQNNTYVKTNLNRTKADLMTKTLEQETDTVIKSDRDQLQKVEEKELAAFAKKFEKEQVALLKKALNDQRDLCARMILKERAIADKALQKTRLEYAQSIKTEQQTIDSLIEQAGKQFEGLQNDCLWLKGMADNLKEAHKVPDKVPDHMICMRRSFFQMAVDNYCAPDVAMQFKLFKLEELYPDLEKYDVRADLRNFGIVGSSINYSQFMDTLKFHGHIYESEAYYLNPAPRSFSLTDLVKIAGEDDVNQMVRAHAEQGTKICLLYLVSIYGNQDPDAEPMDEPMEESDEEADWN